MNGAALTRLLTKASVTQRRLAEMLGVTEAAVSFWVSDSRRISRRTELAIMAVLQLSPESHSTATRAPRPARKSLKGKK